MARYGLMTKCRNCSGKGMTNSPRALCVREHAQYHLADGLTFRAHQGINKIEKTIPMVFPARSIGILKLVSVRSCFISAISIEETI